MDTQFGTNNSGHEEELDDELNEHWHEPGDPDGVIAEDLQRKQEQAEASRTPGSAGHEVGDQQPSSKSRWRVLVVTVLIVAAVGVAYYVGSRHTASPAKKSAASTTKHSQTTKKVPPPIAHYDSATYSVGIDYPNNWVISDTTEKLTITSPDVSMETLNSQTNGHVIVTIQNQQSTLAGFPPNGATASLESDKLTYAQPTPVQRAQTFLSYLGYTSANSLDTLYLTGDNGYQQGQSIPMTDVVKGNPLVSVQFATCSSSFCAKDTPKPVTLKASTWKDADFKATIINILQSLAIN